jgi:RNA polymerase sigma-70 factor, ECF subfamily
VSQPADVTLWLQEIRDGDRSRIDALFSAVYAELRRMAAGQRRRTCHGNTLNTTALVHEAYLKLVRQEQAEWQDRSHFYAVAATAMRQILVNYAERRLAAKRGGGAVHVPLDEADPVAPEAAPELLALDRALQELAALNERQARVVECRFFAGLGTRETAEVLAVSRATVDRDWAAASAWLRARLEQQRQVFT